MTDLIPKMTTTHPELPVARRWPVSSAEVGSLNVMAVRLVPTANAAEYRVPMSPCEYESFAHWQMLPHRCFSSGQK
ncbi:hypothetical protein IEO21_07073 [Rhodonia placenta]|uniref:Uncharacterized protein n=1 Tax=Rhodonia placenta TaxID=104341 RepID=A0A8H7U015_9APHY|nr:hypothetical protein IEO21_07073 [Postia placenta]